MKLVLFTFVVSLALLAGPGWADARDDLLAADRAFSDLSVAKGAHAAFLAYMADDACLYEGRHPPILGKAAAADYYARAEAADPAYPSSQLRWTPLEARVSPDGVLGWTRGTWVWRANKADASSKTVTGYYVTEWRRQGDGHYKFELDIGGTDTP
ncbi:MAG: DUF4440 domain-containing protein [Alphaproteobacteria bacterium]|nr:DUF4440 domain-containing protein [Alphaproteobacteria bacterium]